MQYSYISIYYKKLLQEPIKVLSYLRKIAISESVAKLGKSAVLFFARFAAETNFVTNTIQSILITI